MSSSHDGRTVQKPLAPSTILGVLAGLVWAWLAATTARAQQMYTGPGSFPSRFGSGSESRGVRSHAAIFMAHGLEFRAYKAVANAAFPHSVAPQTTAFRALPRATKPLHLRPEVSEHHRSDLHAHSYC